ncbi:hypothetical protein [Rhodoferax mekongensis]|uniref:Uncharacterized protein n=1 Tax=Rhodoferax mekongensis TaxID=3068341 RepID=A0ABZ0B2B2_9BURK|nr:hypothetical protein [Rhodoferax sp. TBRC 17307]WNO05993.1 hypothetical protein RAN89_06075 [Rhodoferax sp. TBRC 17307]
MKPKPQSDGEIIAYIVIMCIAFLVISWATKPEPCQCACRKESHEAQT